MTDAASPPRPRVFCIGLDKAGTKSLARAFELLGLRALHDARRATSAIERAAEQDLPLLTWIDGHDCYTDAPFYRRYRQLDEQYPNSRFILIMIDICAGEGWPEGCAFLGRPTPRTAAGEIPAFPCMRRPA